MVSFTETKMKKLANKNQYIMFVWKDLNKEIKIYLTKKY